MARYSWEARVPLSAAPHTPLATPRPPQLPATAAAATTITAADGSVALPPHRPFSVHARRDPDVFIGSAVVKAAAPCDLRQQTPPRQVAADTKCPAALFEEVPPPPPPPLPSSRPSTQGGGCGGSNVGQLQALRFRRLSEQQNILDAAMGLQTVASLRRGVWGVGGSGDSGGGRPNKTRGGGDADAARMVRRRARLHLRAAAAAAAEERQQLADHPPPGRHLLLAASSSSAAPTDAAEDAAATGGPIPPSPPLPHAARIELATERRPPSVDEVLPLPLVRQASEAAAATIAAAQAMQVSPRAPPQPPPPLPPPPLAAAANPGASEQLLEELIQCKAENLQLLGGLMSKVARHEASARDANAALQRHEERTECLRAELEAERAAHRTLSRQHADQQHQTRTLRTQVRKLRERAAGFAAGAAAAAAAATSPQGQPAPPGESGDSLELRGQMIQHAYHALDETKLIAASYKRQLDEAREQNGRTAARAAALEERLQATRMLLRERKRHADAEERLLEEDASGLRYPPPDGPHAATSVETLRYTPRPNFPILLKERHGICTRHKPTSTILREILQKLEAKQQRVAELSDEAEVASGLRAIVDDYRAGRGGVAAPAPAYTAHASATIMTFQSQFAPVEFLDTPYRTVRNRGWSRSATLSACVNCFEAAWDTSAALDAGGWKATALAARAALLAGAAVAAAATAPLMARHARALAKQQRAEQRMQQQQQQQQQTPRRPPTRTALAQPQPAQAAAETEEFRDNQSQCSRWQRIMALVHRGGGGGGAAQAFQVTFVPTAAAAAGYVAQVQCKEAEEPPPVATPAAATAAPASPKAREATAAAAPPPPQPRAGRHARSASEAVARQMDERCPNFYLIEVTEGLFSRVFRRWLNQSFREDEEAKATLAYNLLHHSQMFAKEEPMCMLFLSLTTKALPLAVFADVKVVLKTMRDAVARRAEDATELRISYEDCLSAIEDAFLGKPAVDVVKAQCAMRADFASSVSRQISYQGGFDLTEKMSELARYCAAYAVAQHADVYKAVESLLTAHPSGEVLTLTLLGRMLEQHFHLSPYLPPFNIKAFLAKVQSAFELTEGSLSVPDALSALRSMPLQITDELRRVS